MSKVLVIEDNDIILKAMKTILERNGFSVTQAYNGKEALEMVETDDFEVVITDLMLPYVNGMELIQKIKSDITKRFIKIIVVSAIDNELTISEAFKLGADDYIMKPVVATELVNRVRKLVGRAIRK